MANNLLVGLFTAWLMDEASGKRFDSHNGFDFEVEAGNVLSTTGIKGLACSFGTDTANRLSRADDGAFDFLPTQSFSVAAWFNQPGNQNNPMVAKWDLAGVPDNSSWILWHRTSNNRLRFSISSDGTSEETIAEPGIASPFGQWNLGAGGWDALNNEIWVQLNLSPRVTVAHLGGAFAANASLTTGWFEGNGGKVMGNHDQDESYVWDRFITSDEFDTMYAGGTGLFFSDFGGVGIPVISRNYSRRRSA